MLPPCSKYHHPGCAALFHWHSGPQNPGLSAPRHTVSSVHGHPYRQRVMFINTSMTDSCAEERTNDSLNPKTPGCEPPDILSSMCTDIFTKDVGHCFLAKGTRSGAVHGAWCTLDLFQHNRHQLQLLGCETTSTDMSAGGIGAWVGTSSFMFKPSEHYHIVIHWKQLMLSQATRAIQGLSKKPMIAPANSVYGRPAMTVFGSFVVPN